MLRRRVSTLFEQISVLKLEQHSKAKRAFQAMVEKIAIAKIETVLKG